MKQWYALSAIGKDRPGIVADLAEIIFSYGCNLEDSSMTRLGGEFAVLLLFSGGGEDLDERLSSAFKRLEWERRLTVFFRPIDGPPSAYADSERRHLYELVATGVDRAGIVARVCRALADHDVTIREMKTYSGPEAESGTPLYTMQIEMGLPSESRRSAIENVLERIAEELKIDITVRQAAAAPLA